MTGFILLAAATAGAAEVRMQAELVSAVRNVQAGTPLCEGVRQRYPPRRRRGLAGVASGL